MRITWHEAKRLSNLKKHGLDFRDAVHVFSGPTLTFEDDRLNYGEQLWVSMGMLSSDLVVIVHTETADRIRIISVNKATAHEEVIDFTNL